MVRKNNLGRGNACETSRRKDVDEEKQGRWEDRTKDRDKDKKLLIMKTIEVK